MGHKWEIGHPPPPLARVMRVGRQQHQHSDGDRGRLRGPGCGNDNVALVV